MAIYHASIKSFSRGKGESSVAAAAYRAGIDLIDTTKHIQHRYSQRKGVRAYHMLAPKGAPDWCSDASIFWDANEGWETRVNARVARELEVSLPNELTDDQRECLALALGQELVDRFQTVVLVAIHEPSAQGDQRNHHVHLLMSARKVGPQGLGERAGAEFDARQGKGADAVREVRKWVGKIVNEHLDRAGHEARVDHRSLKAQAAEAAATGDLERAKKLDRPATKHIGKVRMALQRKEAEAAAKLSIFGLADKKSAEEIAFDLAVEEAKHEGRLAPIPDGHSHAQALADADNKRSTLGPKTPAAMLRKRSWPLKSGPSPVALHLSRSVRLARTQGNGAEVLNAQAAMVEAWLSTQEEIIKMTIDALRQISPAIQFEPEFDAAIEELRTPRVHIYGTKDFFFEDTEALTRAIRDYGVAMRDPHDARVELRRAQARVSVAEASTGRFRVAQMRAARRRMFRARQAASEKARGFQDRQIVDARNAMVQATENLKSSYHITKLEVGSDEVFGEDAGSSGEISGSSSRGMRLTPKPTRRPENLH